MLLWEYGIVSHRPHYTATDPRNLVFGLLGLLANENKHELRADYMVFFSEIFTTVARSILKNASEHNHFRLDCVDVAACSAYLEIVDNRFSSIAASMGLGEDSGPVED
ncbi:heterokaryon incompatibility protein [Colletotrichum incanum]|uniref:Heterokaryon incompatibility protein n=1 Tax=Colletotrichum incanum TaxID=1573173 RepID=A0A167E9K5_COLIC|nr:heterokaryon incompatibility protein [Colletotrichum incanum]